ncbi:putative dual specificity protein phosphatase [Trypanosoma vivax]|nr:putative dual specificity protein phosphatase [Trypanosoma vivax]
MGVCVARQGPLRIKNDVSSAKGAPSNGRYAKRGNAGEDRSGASGGLTDARNEHAEMSRESSEGFWSILRQTEFAQFFSLHPELLLSNSAAVMCTGVLVPGQIMGRYQVERELAPGTVGRSFVAVVTDEEGAEHASVRDPDFSSKSASNRYVLKVVTFVSRKNLVNSVIDDFRALMASRSKNVLNPVDILVDKNRETLISVSPYSAGQSCRDVVGILEEDKLIRVLRDVLVGIRSLHSSKIYHLNLKPENVLIGEDGRARVADAGFGCLFVSQTLESLLYNGEMACMPPELIRESGEKLTQRNLAKEDVWGFGLFMFRLAYGCEPFVVEGNTLAQVRECLSKMQIVFPVKDWSCVYSLEEAIKSCLEPDPTARLSIDALMELPLFRSNSSYSITMNDSTSSVMRASLFAPWSLCCSGEVGCSVKWQRAKYHWQSAMTVTEVYESGHFCETCRVHLRHSPSKQFTMKVLKRSVLRVIQENQKEAAGIRHALAFSRIVRHCNVLNVIEIVDGRDGCFAMQDCIEGISISKKFPPVINNKDPLFTLKRMLADVLMGLHVLHTNGVYHMCLCPSNVFYDPGKGFKIADFGPLFLTRSEVVASLDTEEPLYSLPSWVVDELNSPSEKASQCLDTFCVGLLAASVVKSVLDRDWGRFFRKSALALNVDDIILRVRESSSEIEDSLVSFIVTALTQETTAKSLLFHPYFGDMVSHAEVSEIKPLVIPTFVPENVIKNKFTSFGESRLLNVLGQDPTLDNSYFMATAFASDSVSALEDMCGPSVLGNASAAEKRLQFTNKLACGLCKHELVVVAFMCLECEGYVRCGKCSLMDAHIGGHTLNPFLVHTVEHLEGKERVAIMVPSSRISVVQPLEELEMQANLPRGTLTQQLSEVLPANRALRRLTMAKLKPQPKVLPKALPKASDFEENSWEEEISNCREMLNPELLLYQFDLTRVPSEIFEPPLLHVVSIDLSYNKLKELPEELCFLVNIESLVVAHNELEKLPSSLSRLAHLDRLDASHNCLVDLPDSFSSLTELSTIALDYNDFQAFPNVLQEIIYATRDTPMLTAIYLTENSRITEFPRLDGITNFPTLKLALDNEPSLYSAYLEEKLEEKYPNISMMWNKIYPDRIINNVFCGSLRSAQSQKVYQRLGIENLLTVGRGLVPVPPVGGRHLTISLDDIEEADIQCTFEEAINFIDESVTNAKGCLVHCFAGLSRSATTVIAYLMMRQGMRVHEAYSVTKQGRPSIFPNKGFLKQLFELDAKLFPDQEPSSLELIGRVDVSMP